MFLIEILFAICLFAIIISYLTAFIMMIFNPNFFKKNIDKQDLPEWEQGWPL